MKTTEQTLPERAREIAASINDSRLLSRKLSYEQSDKAHALLLMCAAEIDRLTRELEKLSETPSDVHDHDDNDDTEGPCVNWSTCNCPYCYCLNKSQDSVGGLCAACASGGHQG